MMASKIEIDILTDPTPEKPYRIYKGTLTTRQGVKYYATAPTIDSVMKRLHYLERHGVKTQ